MNMLDVLKGRLIEGLTITKAKEKASEWELTLAYGGEEAKAWLRKTCAPGEQNKVADNVIISAMSSVALHNSDPDEAKKWLDMIGGEIPPEYRGEKPETDAQAAPDTISEALRVLAAKYAEASAAYAATRVRGYGGNLNTFNCCAKIAAEIVRQVLDETGHEDTEVIR